MVRSRVIDDEARTIAFTRYGYDVLGRRTLVQNNETTTLRTLYDGLGFDVVKESPVYANGGFTDTYNIGIQYEPAGRATGERYRYLDDGQGTSGKYQYIEDSSYQTVSSRYTGERTMLYANGSPVAINRSSGTRGYLGTDILGSTRSVTDNHGVQESYYDYDIFGSPVAGDFTTGADYGYLGKPYDSITGLYNYGYRDYSPQTVRFTTVDPIRDGSNWFAYVNNDPVNYIDLWGLLASEPKQNILGKIVTKVVKLLGDEDGNGSVNISYGGKMALIVGLGYEVGVTIDSNGDFSPYVSGSIGVGIQTPTAKENLSLAQLIKEANGFDRSVSTDASTKGLSSSTTVDIGAGVVVTYDMDNLDDSGIPNSYGYGGVGGGVWKTWTWNF